MEKQTIAYIFLTIALVIVVIIILSLIFIAMYMSKVTKYMILGLGVLNILLVIIATIYFSRSRQIDYIIEHPTGIDIFKNVVGCILLLIVIIFTIIVAFVTKLQTIKWMISLCLLFISCMIIMGAMSRLLFLRMTIVFIFQFVSIIILYNLHFHKKIKLDSIRLIQFHLDMKYWRIIISLVAIICLVWLIYSFKIYSSAFNASEGTDSDQNDGAFSTNNSTNSTNSISIIDKIKTFFSHSGSDGVCQFGKVSFWMILAPWCVTLAICAFLLNHNQFIVLGMIGYTLLFLTCGFMAAMNHGLFIRTLPFIILQMFINIIMMAGI